MFDDRTLTLSRELAARWEVEYRRMVGKFGEAAPERSTAGHTDSGIPIKPSYFPHDIEGQRLEDAGAPGAFPFTRGNLAAQYQLMPWANQPVIGYGLPEQTRQRMDLLASQGMVGYFGQHFYNLVYDLVSHEGLDPDHPAAHGRIGESGMAVYSVSDMERLFNGMDLTKMNVVHITYYQVIPALAQYIAYAERRGIDQADLRGNSMNWYHQSAYVGMSAFPPHQGLKLAVELISYCSKYMPRWNTTNFFGYGIEEAGGTAIQEIGFMLAYGIELVHACVVAGLKPDSVLPRFGFQFAQANDFFEEIAKVRAMRRIWAQTMQERFHVEDPRSMHVRIHTHSSGAVLTAQQPMVNLIRSTIHSLGAALVGTQAMEISAYDEALAIPTEEAATLALRVQQVIQEETNVLAVSDPLAGSYFVEWLTDRVASAALALVAEIETRGGYTAAQATGWIRDQVEDAAERWREDVNSGRKRIVGLNCYTVADEPESAVFRVSEDVEAIAIERVRKLRAERDRERFDKAIGRLRQEAERFAGLDISRLGSDDLIKAAIDAARADATTGEMMAALKGALGWSAPYERVG